MNTLGHNRQANRGANIVYLKAFLYVNQRLAWIEIGSPRCDSLFANVSYLVRATRPSFTTESDRHHSYVLRKRTISGRTERLKHPNVVGMDLDLGYSNS